MNNNVNYDASIDQAMENRNYTEIVRDQDNYVNTLHGRVQKIKGYKYKILIRNLPALEGELTLQEMDKMYRLYSSYGANLTQRNLSREFPRFTFRDLKRLLKAFNISKASVPFAPHIIEEKTIEEQQQLYYQQNENKILKKIEQNQEKYLKKKYEETTTELIKLKKDVASFKEFISSVDSRDPIEIKTVDMHHTGKTLIVYLSDMHIGAFVSPLSIYKNDYNKEEVKNRMNTINTRIQELASFGSIKNIIICNLGDALDGYNAMTTRGGHSLPQSLDNKEQFNFYIDIMTGFFTSLSQSSLFDKISYYSVVGGNHDGDFGYFANKTLEALLHKIDPKISAKVFDQFIDEFTCDKHTFILCHGKDDKDMFKNMPLTINDKMENKINEYIYEKDIRGKIHFVKGDLHQSATTYAKRFRYKSVGSFFGSSEWIHKNFGNTKAACDFDIVDGDNIIETTLILN